MKITKLKTTICDAYRTNWVFVKVFTDEEVYGVGESTLEMRELTVIKALHELERYVVGKDPMNIESIFHYLYRESYWRNGAVLMSALSGIEMALWDIKGKILNVPVYQLLGGKYRDEVQCYANGWFSGAKTPQEFADKARYAIQRGFKALKWDPFGNAYMNISKELFSKAFECIEAVNEAISGNADLIIEGHGRFDVPTAIRIGKELSKFNVLWFEEPIPPDYREGLAEVRAKTGVPVGAGERLFTKYDFNEFLKYKCADFWQPDVSHVGGIGELRKIAIVAENNYIPICPHNPSGPIANAATLQLAASLPNFYLLETMFTDVPYRSKICDEDIKFKNGSVVFNSRSGLGVDFFEDETRKYPYSTHDLRHYVGNLTDIRPTDSSSYFD